MTARLRAFVCIPPGLLRPFVVRRLSRLTAGAFAVPPPPLHGLSGEPLLRAYAGFSSEQARRVLADGRGVESVRRRLWGATHRVGRRMRCLLGVGADRDAMLAAQAAYRVIGIDLRAVSPARVEVPRCRFAGTYGPEVCAVMSSLDAGFFAGLTGGSRLTFSQRLTDGAPACVASLTPVGERVG